MSFRETTYRPKVGEIHVKDSILYSQKPVVVRHLRRQLWPIMEETMDTIAKGVATGAKMLQNMMRPNLIVTGDPRVVRRIVPAKAVQIKNVYMPQALPAVMAPQALHKRQVKPYQAPTTPTVTTAKPPATKPTKPSSSKPVKAAFKMPKPTTIVVGEKPVNTISDDYVLRYSGHDPSYTIRTNTKKTNPFADMGVTGYKHFEATVLRELEEKEERKVEASMFIPDGADVENSEEWQPMMSISSTIKPSEMSPLHTNTSGQDIKPVHEDVQETKGVIDAVVPPSPKTARYMARKPFKPTVVATVAPTSTTEKSVSQKTTTVNPNLLDVPNYPDFFIQQNRHLTPARSTVTTRQPIPITTSPITTTTTASSRQAKAMRTTTPPPKTDDLNSALDFGRYRAHYQHIGAVSPTQARTTVSSTADMEASQSKPTARVVSMLVPTATRQPRVSNRTVQRATAFKATKATIPDPAEAPYDASDETVSSGPVEKPTVGAMSRGKVKFGDRLES